MLIKWNKQLEIGDPVVDSEHRYLIHLINNLYEQHSNGKLRRNLPNVFTHLVKYVHVHFENEEALMKAVNYPGILEHQREHRKLVEQAINLSEQFMDGSETITDDIILFLKEWALEHIADSDMRIKAFLRGERPTTLTATPAFSNDLGGILKKCTMCGKVWTSFEELKNDPDKELIGYQLDATNHLYNLILFNCSCHTTLAMLLKEFIPHADIDFAINEHPDTSVKPPYCLKEQNEPCLGICACQYTGRILDALR